MKRLQIGQKLLLTMLAVIIPSLVLLALLNISSTGEILKANVTKGIKNLAAKSAQSLRELVQDSEATLLTVAGSPVVRNFLAAFEDGRATLPQTLVKMEEAFLDFQTLDKTIQAIRFIDAQGNVLAKVREGVIISRQGQYLGRPGLRAVSSKKERDFFQEAMVLDQGQVSVSNMERGWMEGEEKWCPAMVRFSTPVFFRNGGRAGVVTINVWGESAGATINRLISQAEGTAFLVERNLGNRERNGIYIFHQDSTCEFGNQTGSNVTIFKQYPPFITKAWMTGSEGVNIHPETGDIVAYQFYSPYNRADKGWVVVVEARRDFFMAPLATIKARIVWWAGLVLVLMVLASFFFSKSISRPIREVIDGTTLIGKDLSHRITVRSQDEIGTLAQKINLMASSLEQHLAEKKRIANQICQSEKLASIGEMAAGLAHELNTPLSNVRALSSMAGKDLKNGKYTPESIANDLDDIQEQTGICSEIISGLLSFARHQNPEKTYQDINELIESSLSLTRIQLAKKDIEVVFEKNSHLPFLKIDGHQIKQVFVNILLNAVDALEDGGQLAISLSDTDGKLFIRFVDKGHGIRPERLAKIFDPFFTTKEVGKGTGLGLSVSYGIMKSHGGTIEVDSSPGEGSVFTVILPMRDEENDPSNRR
jgi:two-component system NtrC family sensor kinase